MFQQQKQEQVKCVQATLRQTQTAKLAYQTTPLNDRFSKVRPLQMSTYDKHSMVKYITSFTDNGTRAHAWVDRLQKQLGTADQIPVNNTFMNEPIQLDLNRRPTTKLNVYSNAPNLTPQKPTLISGNPSYLNQSKYQRSNLNIKMIDEKVLPQKMTFGEHWKKYWSRTPEDHEREKELRRQEKEQMKLQIKLKITSGQEGYSMIDDFQDQKNLKDQFQALRKKCRIDLSESQIRNALETAPFLAQEELGMGRYDPQFNITLLAFLEGKLINQGDVLIFDSEEATDGLKGQKYKLQLNIAPQTMGLDEAQFNSCEQCPPKALIKYFDHFQIPIDLETQVDVHQLASDQGMAPKFFLSDKNTFTAELFYDTNPFSEEEIVEDFFGLTKSLSDLVCCFNYNEPIRRYFRDGGEIGYGQLENVKFIQVEGLYWTYLRDSYHIIDQAMPHIQMHNPDLKKQYDAIFGFFYSDPSFFAAEYCKLMPITEFEMGKNPHWLAIGHNSLTVDKFLRVYNDSQLMLSDFSTCGPNFRGADLCFVRDEATREKLMKFYLEYQYENILGQPTKKKITKEEYIEKELPIFRKQQRLLQQQHYLQMALRELRDCYKYLVDDQGKTKKSEFLAEAIDKKLEFQINEAGYYLHQFLQLADEETLERIKEKNFALEDIYKPSTWQ